VIVASIVMNFNHVPMVTPKMRAAAALGLNAGGMAMIGYADPLTPVKTGLMRGNKTIENASPASLTFSATWNQFYTPYQEFGTTRGIKPHLFITQGSARAEPNLIAALTAVGASLA
jgi:hypothetical protein